MQLPGTLGAYVNGYVEGRRLVLFSRDDAGKLQRTEVPADWSAFLKESELSKDWEAWFLRLSCLRGARREDGWLRLDFTDPELRRRIFFDRGGGKAPPNAFLETGIAHYEADVDPIRRFFTDVKTATVQRPRRVYLDIEADSRVPFSRKEEMRILSWAIEDDDGNAQLDVLAADTNGAEADLLGGLWGALEPYDQIVAWYGDGFDFPVIWSRSEQRNVKVDARRWLYLDQLEVFKRMNAHVAESGDEKRSYKLDNIATALLGQGKDPFDASKTYEAWAAGGAERRRMVRYNAKDTALLPRIEKKTGYIGLFATLCEVCRLFGDTIGLQPTRQMDGFLLRLARERGHHFPSKMYREDTNEKQFKGAFVMQPKTIDAEWRARRGMANGIARDVHVADFASLYPSIILTWNMSADTKDERAPVNGPVPEGLCRSPKTGTSFRTGQQGLLPLAVSELIRLRKQYNDLKASLPPGTPEWLDADRRSMAYKVAANSFYGVVGSPYSRYFDQAIGESITQNGVWLLENTISAAERKGWEVIYADTDSLCTIGCTKEEFGDFVQWCNAELYPELLRKVGCAINKISLAYEKAFDRVVFVSAKRYCARFSHYKGKVASADSKPEVKGLEYKRGDTSALARTLQSQVVTMLMDGVEDIAEFHALLAASRLHALSDPLPLEEVVLAKSLSKPLKEYAAKAKLDGTPAAQPAHVVVAKKMLARGQDVGEGTKIEYVVVDEMADSPDKRYLPAADYAGECDRHHVWESLVYPPTARLLKAAFPAQETYWDLWGRSRPPAPRRKKDAPEEQARLFAATEATMEKRFSIPPEPPLPR